MMFCCSSSLKRLPWPLMGGALGVLFGVGDR